MSTPQNDRPILDEAKRKALIGLGGSVVTAAVAFGAISPELAEQISTGWANVLAAIVTVLPVLTSALHALGIVKGAEPKTTPVDSPADHAGNPLVSVADLHTYRDDVEGAVDRADEDPEPPEAMTDSDEAPDAPPGRHSQLSAEETGSIEPVD